MTCQFSHNCTLINNDIGTTTQVPADSRDSVAFDHMVAQAQATATTTEDAKENVGGDPGAVKMSRKGGGGGGVTKAPKGTKKIAASTSTTSPPLAKTASLMSKGGSVSGGKEKEGGMTKRSSTSTSSGKSKI